MTRIASLLGLLTGIGALVDGVQAYNDGSSMTLWHGIFPGLLLLMGAHGTFRGKIKHHVLMLATALGLLVFHLPSYFRGPNLWPDLILIFGATLTLGLGMVGLAMGRVGRPHGGPAETVD